ncbi:MAG TPA: hypothetical protein VLJ86_03825 [Ramlibacter sp.]|nr:hypothetical protein [Ramlibacter sp.]
MSQSAFFGGPCVRAALLAGLLLPLLCAAESALGSKSASARVTLTVVVPPVLRILQVTSVPAGLEYRVWTNMRSVHFYGRVYHFERVGQTTLTVPGSAVGAYIHQGV